MKVVRSRLQDGHITLSCTASSVELKSALDYAYGAFASSVGLKPAEGQSIEDCARQTFGLNGLAPQIQPHLERRLVALAVDKSGLVPAYVPRSAILSQPKSGMGIEFEFDIMPKPEYELTSYGPVSISIVRPVIFEEDVEREMESYSSLMESFSDPDKHERLRALVVAKLEDQNARSFAAQQQQAVSIEVAKRLEGEIPDEIMSAMFAEHLESLKAQLRNQGTSFGDFLEEHGGEESVNMLLMWQAREALRQGYALDAVYRHEKLKVTEADINAACCTMSGLDDPGKARQNARAMGMMHAVKEAAQRFKATSWLMERAEVSVRDQSPLEEQ